MNMHDASMATGPVQLPQFDRVILVHGFGADMDEHWFPWLAQQVPQLCRVPLPTPNTPVARDWIQRVVEAVGALDETTAIVSHSLGGITAARAIQALSNTHASLGAFVAVAPFSRPLPPSGLEDLDGFLTTGLGTFLDSYRPERVRQAVRQATVIRSDDDPLVPAACSDAFAAELDATTIIVPDAGHFLTEDGATRLDPVLTALHRSHHP